MVYSEIDEVNKFGLDAGGGSTYPVNDVAKKVSRCGARVCLKQSVQIPSEKRDLARALASECPWLNLCFEGSVRNQIKNY